MASIVESMKVYDPNYFYEVCKKLIYSNELIVGGGFWLEPNQVPGKKYFAPYVFRDNNDIKMTWDYSTDAHAYFQYD